jgi:hypothetical protein
VLTEAIRFTAFLAAEAQAAGAHLRVAQIRTGVLQDSPAAS